MTELRHAVKWQHLVLSAIALTIATVFPWRYAVPFRLDDVILMEWSNAHTLLDAFDPVRGQIVNSVRPIFAITSWLLTHLAGPVDPFPWHVTLVTLILVALVFIAKLSAYLTRSHSALIATPLLYLLGFTSILNVFFWFSDLTYALELCFATIAWYYGIRGLLDGSPGRLMIGLASGIVAVLSKEPAVILVHVALIGVLIAERKSIVETWRATKASAIGPLALYALLLLTTVYVVSVSPTRTNRFFSLPDPHIGEYVSDRLSYYSAILCSPVARVLLFTPVVFLGLRRALYQRIKANALAPVFLFLTSIVLAAVVLKSALSALPILALVLISFALSDGDERRLARQLLPFLVMVLIAFGTLLFTIQLVKTQLTEIAFIMSVIAGTLWVLTGRTLLPVLRRYPNASTIVATLAVGTIVSGARTKLAKQEHVLREVSAVRWNANDAVAWAAKHLPQNSSLLVTTYAFHGFSNPGALTGADDETKLREQPTFDAGYVYIYLEQLGRRDIDRGYLTDSAEAPRIFDAYRSQPNSYVLVQTGLDAARLHPIFGARDSLVAQFTQPPYPSELWRLGK